MDTFFCFLTIAGSFYNAPNLISESDGDEKNELVIYYRMAIIVEAVLLQYK